ncbi:alpha/beta hydrolase [Ramlibacter sp. PS4R-6]|uniref:alpha/beta hydrolase n=1 Tax=Ramlibacter sp. PS4R-6 TaxID=3133438 RepID=UPI0030A1A1C5
MNALRRILLIAAGLALAACGGGGSGSGGEGVPQVGRLESFNITSSNTGALYPIDVYVPPQYDASASARLPVIYAVDGDARFGYLAASNPSVTRFTALKEVLQRRGTAAILVGIGGTARRNTDFLPPGSVAYHEFLTKELVPRIDSQYRTQAGNRILNGLSYGGTITFLCFTYEATGNATFKQFWSTEANGPDGALAPAEAALAAQVQGANVPLVLFLAAATPGTNTNGAFVNSLYTQMAGHHYAGLDLQFVSFSADHVGSDLPAFEEALKRWGP